MTVCVCVTVNGRRYACAGDPFERAALWRDAATGEPIEEWLRPVIIAQMGRSLRIGPARTPTYTNQKYP